ncbi:group II intron maturase-specific domain-containing protein [Thermoactinomyces mirandus]|uniref:group II intron maturase-specific domain-containing protein n=1 Tax=Thermoactinomyces mirandus TaxID=2756294 RepID=UPI001C68B9F4|nr:group II intron maturase-specific domain-containing protein [Thermoactinomyces mirandus]
MDKTRIVKADEGFDFLGHTFRRVPSRKDSKLRTYYYPSDKAMKTVKKKVKEIIKHSSHLHLPDLVDRLNPVLKRWGNYFKTGNAKVRFDEIDKYVTYNLTIMLHFGRNTRKEQRDGRNILPHGITISISLYVYGRCVPTSVRVLSDTGNEGKFFS